MPARSTACPLPVSFDRISDSAFLVIAGSIPRSGWGRLPRGRWEAGPARVGAEARVGQHGALVLVTGDEPGRLPVPNPYPDERSLRAVATLRGLGHRVDGTWADVEAADAVECWT